MIFSSTMFLFRFLPVFFILYFEISLFSLSKKSNQKFKSSGAKTTFSYERLIEMVVQEIIDPDDTFVCGSSYELPVHYGLLDKKFLNEKE